MKLILLLVIALLSAPLLTSAQEGGAPEARAFTISSLNTAFAMQGEFKGEYRIYPEWIEIRVTQADIRVSEHCPYKGRRMLSAVKFALATSGDDGRWKLASAGEDFLLGRVMSPGDAHRVEEIYFHLPRDASVDLSKHWLVVQMGDNVLDVPAERRRRGCAFAHSRRDIFSRPEGDAETAPPGGVNVSAHEGMTTAPETDAESVSRFPLSEGAAGRRAATFPEEAPEP